MSANIYGITVEDRNKHKFAENIKRLSVSDLKSKYLNEYTSWQIAGFVAFATEDHWANAFDDFRLFLTILGPKSSITDFLKVENRELGFIEGNVSWANLGNLKNNFEILPIDSFIPALAEEMGISLENLVGRLYLGQSLADIKNRIEHGYYEEGESDPTHKRKFAVVGEDKYEKLFLEKHKGEDVDFEGYDYIFFKITYAMIQLENSILASDNESNVEVLITKWRQHQAILNFGEILKEGDREKLKTVLDAELYLKAKKNK